MKLDKSSLLRTILGSHSNDIENINVAVVIPAYCAENYIRDVVAGIPQFVSVIVIVDDCSKDSTSKVVDSLQDPRIHLFRHEYNQGVGGATLTGYNEACKLGADIIVKMDSDDQMDPDYLLPLIEPILKGEADYTKGNRFIHLRHLREMPPVRRFGNFWLSFMNKMSSGYWNIFDPTNGYTAITSSMIKQIDPEYIHKRYFFESSMLLELGLQRAVIRDVYIPARYRDESSSLSELDSLLKFPGLLIKGFIRRIFIQYIIRDFSAVTIFLLLGIVFAAFGSIFGIIQWFISYKTGHPATTGTVMLAVLPFILGSQFLLQSILMDIQNTPRSTTKNE